MKKFKMHWSRKIIMKNTFILKAMRRKLVMIYSRLFKKCNVEKKSLKTVYLLWTNLTLGQKDSCNIINPINIVLRF